MNTTFVLHILAVAAVTYALRAVPLALCRGKIRNRFVLSFLHYMPYAVLTVMTVPAIFTSTPSVVSAVAGFAVALWLAFRGKDLLTVAGGACGAVLLVELARTVL